MVGLPGACLGFFMGSNLPNVCTHAILLEKPKTVKNTTKFNAKHPNKKLRNICLSFYLQFLYSTDPLFVPYKFIVFC